MITNDPFLLHHHCHSTIPCNLIFKNRCDTVPICMQSFDGRNCSIIIAARLRSGTDGTSSLHWACHSRTFRVAPRRASFHLAVEPRGKRTWRQRTHVSPGASRREVKLLLARRPEAMLKVGLGGILRSLKEFLNLYLGGACRQTLGLNWIFEVNKAVRGDSMLQKHLQGSLVASPESASNPRPRPRRQSTFARQARPRRLGQAGPTRRVDAGRDLRPGTPEERERERAGGESTGRRTLGLAASWIPKRGVV